MKNWFDKFLKGLKESPVFVVIVMAILVFIFTILMLVITKALGIE